ncbi:glycoside hydrolase family 15 protein [Streptomyces sp. 891-h]|uniref:glycoside hydrolase family 15 protein n=1 Tax=unclassified Streptomyces TaxID=2593676 RepID=UPI001FAA9DE7|nr:glycoside hydrolase family 15 protein [Streptomyces sp. 891-h]UNZ19879.1 glycoside hydrolase family 15 protein [Streptomyces sp. 891-h]
MATLIEDYALIGDMQTAALVARDGSVDWLCLPRFDSPAVFAGLLGTDDHGFWRLAPAARGPARPAAARRRYRGESLILESEWDTPEGTVRVTDFMPPRHHAAPCLVRIVEGVTGRVRMSSALRMRFSYGRVVPWVRREGGRSAPGLADRTAPLADRTVAVAGPDSLWLDTEAETYGSDLTTHADFTVSAGQRVALALSWQPSHLPAPPRPDAEELLRGTERFWAEWTAQCSYTGRWREAVMRSLITLKALTYAPTGGIVAAPTTSLPEELGGVRNWDYRYTWLRDAAITLGALLRTGYREEARRWREWLLRAVAGDAQNLQIMYGVAGERELAESELAWLPGYEGSRPVRIGNGAADQLQLDVYGEVVDALWLGQTSGLTPDVRDDSTHILQMKLMNYLESNWREPDEGIWEVRGPRRHFTHSKVMTWVAADRTVRRLSRLGLDAPVARWRALRDDVHREVCAKGYDADRNTFTQSYGSRELDAALLLIPQVGFLPPDDPRVVGTVEAVQRELCEDGFVRRYDPGVGEGDGLPGGEGVFLACSFWLAHDLALIGRAAEGRRLFERLLELRNDVGLLAEEWDTGRRRLVGNFPQAFSHVPLIDAALRLGGHTGHAG